MLPADYASLENTQKIRLLRTKVVLNILQYEFGAVYGKTWWEGTLRPRMERLAATPRERLDRKEEITAKKYADYLAKLNRERKRPEPENMDVSVMMSALLYDRAFGNLPCRRESSRKSFKALDGLRDDRNYDFHSGGEVSRAEILAKQNRSLRLMRDAIQVYGRGVFEADVAAAVENYDFDARHSEYQEALRLEALKNEFGTFYGQYAAACDAARDPATRRNGLEGLLKLAHAGFPAAARDAVQILLHDPELFSLERAIDTLEQLSARTRTEDAQLLLLKELLGKQTAALNGDAAAAEDLAHRFGDERSAVYAPGRDIEFALLAWRGDHRCGMEYLYDAALRGRAEALEAILNSGDRAWLDRLAREIAQGRVDLFPRRTEQLPWFVRLMDAGSRAALDILTEHYPFGQAVCCSNTGAADPQQCRVCKKACEAGIARVMQHRIFPWFLSCQANDRDEDRIFAQCERLAQHGPQGAQALLGACYAEAIGCTYAPDKARPLLEAGLAVPEYRAFAHYWLGVLAEYDAGAPDLAAAAAHYRQAAAEGFAPAVLEAFVLDAASPDKSVRRSAARPLQRQKGNGWSVGDAYSVETYRGINAKGDKRAAFALCYKVRQDFCNNVGAAYAPALLLVLRDAGSQREMLGMLREEGACGNAAACQAEALYLLTRPNGAADLARARELWAKANKLLRDQTLPAGRPRSWGLFHSHGRKDLIAHALQTGLNGRDAYALLSAAGFRIPYRRLKNGDALLFGVRIEQGNSFYRWLREVYLDRFEAHRNAVIREARPAKDARMLWYAATKDVIQKHLPGRPDREGAVCYDLARQGRREYFDRLYAGRTALTGLDRCRRNVDLYTLSADPAQRRALLEEAIALNAAPTPYVQSVLYCLRGRESENPEQEQVWYRLAERVQPDGAMVRRAWLAFYCRQKMYQEAADKADSWLTPQIVEHSRELIQEYYWEEIETGARSFGKRYERCTSGRLRGRYKWSSREVYRIPPEPPMEDCLADEIMAVRGLVNAGMRAYAGLYETGENLTPYQKEGLRIKMDDPSKAPGGWRTYEPEMIIQQRKQEAMRRQQKAREEREAAENRKLYFMVLLFALFVLVYLLVPVVRTFVNVFVPVLLAVICLAWLMGRKKKDR